jgi:hypothetical protein
LARLKKHLLNPPPNLLALENNHPHMRKVTRAYRHPNLRWKDVGKKKQDKVPDANVPEINKV